MSRIITSSRLLVLATVIVIGALVVTAGRAHAYPQFQLSRDQTCTSCHISPAGGGLLNENGLAVAENGSQLGHAPEFLYGKVKPPKWLELGGDLRGAGGFLETPEKAFVFFPMQGEIDVRVKLGNFSLYANPGARPAEVGNEAATHVYARDYYLMWKQKKDANEGLFVRAGHFMPVFGLRFAEHAIYTRRYGGTQLYSEPFGLAVEYIKPKYEVHVTGFVKDELIDAVEHANGAAFYGEVRPDDKTAVGVEGMAKITTDDKQFRGGVTAKRLVSDVLLQGELQFVNQLIDSDRGKGTGAPLQLVGYLMASKALGGNGQFLVDVGLGHFDENLRIKNLDRDCVDLNLHYFVDSHLEMILNTRFEMIAFGAGGNSNGAYALLQAHIRL